VFTLVALAATSAWPATGAAQAPFSFNIGRGELGLQGTGSVQRVGAVGGSDQSFLQWLRLPMNGYMIHPRIINYSLTVSPQFNQHEVSHLDGSTRSRSTGTDLSINLLPTRRLSMTIQSVRSSGRTRGGFSTESDFKSSSFTVASFFRHRYFPAVLSFQRRGFEDAWSSSFTAGPAIRDQSEQRLRLEVRNKKLMSVLTRSSKNDRRGSDDFVSNSAQFSHRAGWGKGSSLATSLSFFSREGSGPIQQRALSERLTVQHTQDVTTNIFLTTRAWGRGDDITSNSRSLGATTNWRASNALIASISTDLQRFDMGEAGSGVSRFGLTPQVTFNDEIRPGMRVTARTAVGMERRSIRGGDFRFLDVVDERHSVGESFRFALDKVRVDLASIDIWTEDRTLHLEAEVDYRILDTGGFVEIQILPGSRVDESAVLLVSYRYEVTTSERSSLFFYNYDLGLVWNRFSVRHGRRERAEDVTSDVGVTPGSDDRDIWYGVGFGGNTFLGSLRLDANRRSRRTSGLTYVSKDLEGQLTLPLRGRMRVSFQGSVGTVDAIDGTTRTAALGGQLNWTVTRSLRLRGGMRAFRWERRDVDTEVFMSGYGTIAWDWGRINTILSYDQSRRWNGAARADHHWSLRMVRRF
jgi:hypothetical protein